MTVITIHSSGAPRRTKTQPATQRRPKQWVDQHQASDAFGIAAGEQVTHLRAETVAGDDRPGHVFGVEQTQEVVAPGLDADGVAGERFAMAAQIGSQDIPVRFQRGLLRELGPARVVAGEPVQQNEGAAFRD